MNNVSFTASRFQVTAVNPANEHQWEQKIVIAEDEEDAKVVMRARLPLERQHWEINYAEEVSAWADHNGGTGGD